jgi:hypothetical protein
MKLNKWTIGLAAVGVVSLGSTMQAEETANNVMTALSSTTLSGYVDVSAQWNVGTGNRHAPSYAFGGPSKADGFNLNVVQLSLEKPLDESEWASGYKVDLWLGPDANTLFSQSILAGATADLAIRQAYVALRTPVLNGIDWKVGVFDTVVGYESLSSPNNPNFTRSWGFSIEPTTHTGILGTYRVSDLVAVSAGVANTVGPVINDKAHGPNLSGTTKAESYKTYMASIAVSAPDEMGVLAGSTLYGGIVNGFNGLSGDNQTSYYAGATLATPVAGLRLGAAFDYLNVRNAPGDAYAIGLYASFQATEKLSLHGRGEYFEMVGGAPEIWSATGTVQYDLWENVLSRLEVRWDTGDNGHYFGGGSLQKNSVAVIGNLVYRF